jgi:dinuclear metal center YbgI/SA1388 family protein
MKLPELDAWLSEYLAIGAVGDADVALNGMQVARRNGEVSKVAFAVDACMESIRRAADWGADMLFVHHGLFWGKQLPLTGGLYGRLRALMEADLCLWAAHLPLDMHPEVGNNAGLARFLGLEDTAPFGNYHGIPIGIRGTLKRPMGIEEIAALLAEGRPDQLRMLPFGPASVRTAAVVSGGAAELAREAIREGLDLYVTGDASHEIYHDCLEGRIHAIFAGHYRTETVGVRLLADRLGSMGLSTRFVDVPTGL